MNEESKTNEDDWSVEPPRKDHQRLKTVLRVALIVAALGAVMAAGMVLFGKSFKQPLMGAIGIALHDDPYGKNTVQTAVQANEADCGEAISGKE